MIVPAMARPNVPPRLRTKLEIRSEMADGVYSDDGCMAYFRNAVTTAISRLSTPAWTAMRALIDAS